MKDWTTEFVGEMVYEVECENKGGGGVTHDTFKTLKEAEDSAWVLNRHLTYEEKKKYRVNINTWKWNSKEEEYEYLEGCTYEEAEEEEEV